MGTNRCRCQSCEIGRISDTAKAPPVRRPRRNMDGLKQFSIEIESWYTSCNVCVVSKSGKNRNFSAVVSANIRTLR